MKKAPMDFSAGAFLVRPDFGTVHTSKVTLWYN